MSGWRLPAPAGRWIDRRRPLQWRFEGRPVPAFAGDSVASALLAAGITLVARSQKLHRPRGIFGWGPEEPCALLDVGRGPGRVPDTRATEIEVHDGLECRSGNAWPGPRLDLTAINDRLAGLLPAGFYYKTFMAPRWSWWEPMIRRLAGLGHAADAVPGAAGDHHDEVSRHVDLLVVGGGAAGLVAALAAAAQGRQVLLAESAPHLGGWAAAEDDPRAAEVQALASEAVAAGVECLVRCTVAGLYDHGLAVAVQQQADGVRERLWKIRARRIVLATGAIERPMLFPDNDRPGVMLASAVQRYAALHGVACGRRVVVATACDSGYASARALLAAGLTVAAVVDLRPDAAAEVPPGVPVHRGAAVVAVQGRRAVRGVVVRAGDSMQAIEADLVASAGGWTPTVHLHSMAGGRLQWNDEASMFVPAAVADGVQSVGAAAGAFDWAAALEHARRVGAGDGGPAPVGGLGRVPADLRPGADLLPRRAGKMFVDLQNDVSADDVALAVRENYRSVEHLKRYTTLGMGTDQGKTSNVNALVLLGAHSGRGAAEVGTTRFRPPFKPVTLATLAGGRTGARCRPLRRMPGHEWHLRQQALMEEFGGWLRPAAYPRAGETLAEAATREAGQVRLSVGLFEASPLGKIELYGPGAADFLDLMYVGTLSTLPVGGARYAVLLDENGVVADDGIVARLGAQHFWVNTTSAGANKVALAFEEWLQCEYLQHRVLVTPVGAQWGNVTVSGPRAWTLLHDAGFDPALAPDRMPHMSMRETTWQGLPLRVLRASYTGELGYEINVPAAHTEALLDRLAQAGAPLGVLPFGVEALMVLRTEKGYLHVGADTDGTTLPGDVGLDRGAARKAANFVGRRSLLRPAALDPQRLQGVGLVPLDRRTPLPVGAHVCDRAPPAPAEGFVTSACHSPALGHPVALALLRRGRARLGEQVTLWHLGRAIRAEVCPTPFFDPQGARLHGA